MKKIIALIDHSNVSDLRSSDRNVIIQSLKNQTHPASNKARFELARTALGSVQPRKDRGGAPLRVTGNAYPIPF